MKSAARTYTVTGIRLNRCGMIDDRVQRSKNRRMRPVTQVAMRRAYRQPRHHHAQQPGSYAGCGFDGRLHSRIILPQGIAEVIRGRSEIRFGSPPDDGKSGSDPIRKELLTNCPEPDQRHQPLSSNKHRRWRQGSQNGNLKTARRSSSSSSIASGDIEAREPEVNAASAE